MSLMYNGCIVILFLKPVSNQPCTCLQSQISWFRVAAVRCCSQHRKTAIQKNTGLCHIIDGRYTTLGEFSELPIYYFSVRQSYIVSSGCRHHWLFTAHPDKQSEFKQVGFWSNKGQKRAFQVQMFI